MNVWCRGKESLLELLGKSVRADLRALLVLAKLLLRLAKMLLALRAKLLRLLLPKLATGRPSYS